MLRLPPGDYEARGVVPFDFDEFETDPLAQNQLGSILSDALPARRAASPCVVGLIADTHGLMRPEALAALMGLSHIIHAGDIGSPTILEQLRALAPVTAVRGNNDDEPWARRLPLTATIAHGPHILFVVHEIAHLHSRPLPPGTAAVITGHSHRPRIESRDGVLYVNPGSAGPRRFKLPVSVATLAISGQKITARIVELDVPPPRGR
ncbi:MAG: metallophosphoesterase family protein [Steroidobacteraceae bacterium]